MVTRPSNHVTQDLARRYREAGASCPDLTEAMLVWLEEYFPARCLGPRETVEDHLRYAGKVELVAVLRAQLNERSEGNEHLDPLTVPADLASA
jgi:hypothetical protein